ncbi:MAG: 2Fe-2S iron-sulfur cluster-binding protein [Candidatus Peribacteraceae bacterium]|nr:2Fe-2S iron-sulfur cluster-binding protein [Candidatus Peribacteraceae bacterium]
MPKVTFIVSGQKREVEGQKGDTILKIALEAGIPMEAACGGMGFCGTCRCKVKESSHVSPINDNERNFGITPPERLGCQATVEEDVTVEIEED